MSKPLVSTIISTYNSEEFIKGRLDNLIEQTIFDRIEIIIVNSGSEQNEEFIITKYLSKHKNIKYLKTEKRETIYKAWNRGIKISSGKYITNANTDDRLRIDALEILLRKMEVNNDCAIAYADQYITNIPNAALNDIKKKKKFNRLEYSRIKLFFGYLAGPQSMWRSSLHFNDDIWFDEKLEVAGDYDFVCRVAEKYPLIRVPGVLGWYYKSDQNLNKELQNIDLTTSETYQIQDKYLRRYINSLDAENFNRFKSDIIFWTKLPKLLVGAIRKFLEKNFPAYQLPPKIFYHWTASVIEEERGNLAKSKKFCVDYNIRSSYINMNNQIIRINSLKD